MTDQYLKGEEPYHDNGSDTNPDSKKLLIGPYGVVEGSADRVPQDRIGDITRDFRRDSGKR